jgi:hypothetical protein
MAVAPSIDVSGWLDEQLAQASRDLLRAMVHDVAAAMIDRLVHHADVVALKGLFYRLKDRPRPRPHPHSHQRRPMTNQEANIHPTQGGQFSAVVDRRSGSGRWSVAARPPQQRSQAESPALTSRFGVPGGR